MRRWLLPIFCLCIVLFANSPTANSQQNRVGYIRSDRLGITHITITGLPTPESRYQQALSLGAGWDRFPIYWDLVQKEPPAWTWEQFDMQVGGALTHGLKINAILIGVPAIYRDGERILGIDQPIFADGTDAPLAGKTLNPDNPWALFVWETVNRYKPGGTFSREATVPLGAGIRVWEIWNEPDFLQFWKAGPRDYARLLKISYLVIKMADPSADVMFGGLLYPTGSNFMAQVLNVIINDPLRDQYDWYFDLVGVHAYADPWRSGWLVLFTRQTMIAFGFDRPIWLNETGVPLWNDYPGPTWMSSLSAERRATAQQQAWYLIQSAAYAWSEGADKIFFHQLYDDCGDQPAGTNFPPNNGTLCRPGTPCFGDAHGIFRNNTDAICFSQSPNPGQPRPVATAYRLLAQVFGAEPFGNGDFVNYDVNVVTITMERPRTNERITVMWNRRLDTRTIAWEAVGENAELISLSGSQLITPNERNFYVLEMPPAVSDINQTGSDYGGVTIGGEPYILIERRTGRVQSSNIDLALPTLLPMLTPAPTLPATQVIPRATIPPENDTRPPVANVLPLPETSLATFRVEWTGTDESGVQIYLIWVRIDGGQWLPWLETAQTSAEYSGQVGQTYEFAAWAQDLAGNWSENVQLQAQATTQVSE